MPFNYNIIAIMLNRHLFYCIMVIDKIYEMGKGSYMELRVLKYFLMVAREENITKAANRLNIT